jgi:hypothetical protein
MIIAVVEHVKINISTILMTGCVVRRQIGPDREEGDAA